MDYLIEFSQISSELGILISSALQMMKSGCRQISNLPETNS